MYITQLRPHRKGLIWAEERPQSHTHTMTTAARHRQESNLQHAAPPPWKAQVALQLPALPGQASPPCQPRQGPSCAAPRRGREEAVRQAKSGGLPSRVLGEGDAVGAGPVDADPRHQLQRGEPARRARSRIGGHNRLAAGGVRHRLRWKWSGFVGSGETPRAPPQRATLHHTHMYRTQHIAQEHSRILHRNSKECTHAHAFTSRDAPGADLVLGVGGEAVVLALGHLGRRLDGEHCAQTNICCPFPVVIFFAFPVSPLEMRRARHGTKP